MSSPDASSAGEPGLPAGQSLVPGACRLSVSIWHDGLQRDVDDSIAMEVPVALLFNGISHAVMMATPADLEDFALGFSLTEGLLHSPGELYGVEVVEVKDGLEARLEVSSESAWRLRERRRNLAGRTGCGLCGADSLAQVRQTLPPVPIARLQVEALLRAELNLKAGQRLQHATGSTHAAAWCNPAGDVLLLREDVGRHNALDKLIGAMSRAGTDPAEGFFAITSRASFEMVQKVAMAGAGAMVAVSAPTSLAIEVAQRSGVALAGLVRERRLVAYSFPERLGWQPASGRQTA